MASNLYVSVATVICMLACQLVKHTYRRCLHESIHDGLVDCKQVAAKIAYEAVKSIAAWTYIDNRSGTP
jgi:hypothetical protein